MSFTIINKLIFIDSFQLSSSIDSLVKDLSQDDFTYLSQKSDSSVLYLAKQKEFYLYEYTSDFEKFKEESSSETKFNGSLTNKRITVKEYEHVLKVW